MRSCNIDGALLQPDRPAAPIDASILAKAGLSEAAQGELWRADSWVSGWHYPQLIAADSMPYTLRIEELLEETHEAAGSLGFVATEANFTHTSLVKIRIHA